MRTDEKDESGINVPGQLRAKDQQERDHWVVNNKRLNEGPVDGDARARDEEPWDKLESLMKT